MKTFKIYKNGLCADMLCCEIQAKNEKAALLKYKRLILCSGQYWFEKHGHYKMFSSYGGYWFAVEIIQ